MKISRNEPCPCGSGIKYKKCHLGKPLPGEETDGDATMGQDVQSALADRRVQGAIVVGILVSVGAGIWQGAYTGIVVGAACLLGIIAWASFRNPPPPNPDAGDPAALNFGRQD